MKRDELIEKMLDAFMAKDGDPWRGYCRQDQDMFRKGMGDVLDLVLKEESREGLEVLRKALYEASRSLRIIADQSGKDGLLAHIDQIRGYANSRANVAEKGF